jgi:hypothetical protein
MNTKIMTVTPKLAAEWLKSNHSNRPRNRRYVYEVCRALENGTFQTTHQGIAFDDQGRLRDGQHRLTAIVETGIAVKMLVTTGLTEEQLLVIDDGRRRTFFDVLSMTGNASSRFCGSVAKEMMIGGYHLRERGKPKIPSRQEQFEFFTIHAEAAAFAEKLFNKASSGFQLAFLAAVIARAYYTVDHKRLEHFSKVLVDGFYETGDEVIIRLRNQIQQIRRESRRTNSTNRDEIYAKTQRALWNWIRGENPESLYSAREELFPLPGEEGPVPPQPIKSESLEKKPKRHKKSA